MFFYISFTIIGMLYFEGALSGRCTTTLTGQRSLPEQYCYNKSGTVRLANGVPCPSGQWCDMTTGQGSINLGMTHFDDSGHAILLLFQVTTCSFSLSSLFTPFLCLKVTTLNGLVQLANAFAEGINPAGSMVYHHRIFIIPSLYHHCTITVPSP